MPGNSERRPMCRQNWQGPELLERMARELHVDLALAARFDNGEGMPRARARCLDCQSTRQCEDWLDTSCGLPLPPDFCPNAPFFHLCIASTNGPVTGQK